MKKELRAESDTKSLAAEISTLSLGGISLGLIGELGSGKTTFVRYLGQALGASEISSPSYVLQHHYTTTTSLLIDHWDLYRLSSLPEEILEPPGREVLRLIEWVDRFPTLIEQMDIIMTFDFLNPTLPESRQISFSGRRVSELLSPLTF